jgi:type IV pilus assembly protein PilC
MDNAGAEVKDVIEAATEQEAQTLIRQKGYFPTRIVEKGRGKKDAKGKGGKKKGPTGQKKKKTFAFGGVNAKKLTTPACRSCAACGSSKGKPSPGPSRTR